MKKKYISILLTIFIIGIAGCANKEPVETISTIDEVIEVESSEIIESTEIESSDIEESTEIESSEVIESTEMTSEVEITTEETTTVEGTTEIEETETPTVAEMSTKSTEVLFDTPIAMYTTQNCNVRSRADKESDLIITLAKDVEIYCWGTDGDWSIVDCQGIKAYIHSTLLTETKPAPAQTTKPAEQSKPSQTTQQTQQKPAETKPQTPSQPSGTITAVTPEGKTVTLRPYKPEKGIYLDETGAARNANGQEVSIITGELYVEPETVHIDLSGGLATGSGATAH
ncbi:MAG: hypothetical protein IJO85_04700 [Lachnospiraceae bacterium]|nr:hypothetical protein [Lachnospiraceae bacterium]